MDKKKPRVDEIPIWQDKKGKRYAIKNMDLKTLRVVEDKITEESKILREEINDIVNNPSGFLELELSKKRSAAEGMVGIIVAIAEERKKRGVVAYEPEVIDIPPKMEVKIEKPKETKKAGKKTKKSGKKGNEGSKKVQGSVRKKPQNKRA